MKSSYPLFRSIGCRVPAPSVCFGVGAWMVIARQSPWGKGAIAGEEARRGRKTTPDHVILSRGDGEGPQDARIASIEALRRASPAQGDVGASRHPNVSGGAQCQR